MAPSFSVTSWWEGGGRGNHRLRPRKNLASLCRAILFSSSQVKGHQACYQECGSQPSGMFILLRMSAPRFGHPWYGNTKGSSLNICVPDGRARIILDVNMCVWTRNVGAVGFMCVWSCSYEGRMAMSPIVCPGPAPVGISPRHRKEDRRNAFTRREDRGHQLA